jgi:hypothetical protein
MSSARPYGAGSPTGQVRNIGVHGMKAQAAFITSLFPIAA